MILVSNNLFKMVIFFKILVLKDFGANCIWPPPYKVNLSDEETFVISELLQKSDVQDVYDEEEMIKREEMEQMKMRPQTDKYYRIHQHVQNSNNQLDSNYDLPKKDVVREEFNPDIEEPLPWKAGFVDENGKFIPEKGMIYFDEEAKNDKETEKEKRADSPKEEDNYDYSNLKSQYNKEIKIAAKSNETLQYSTVKEDESIKDSAKSLVNFKETPRNCTAEETKGIGMGAVECFWMESQKPRMKSRVFEKILRVFFIWMVVYLVVAIPCWCQYGWCCCCCRCKFCSPKDLIDDIKRFSADNPVGVYHDEEGNKVSYKATHYERYAQKKLDQEINRL